MVNGSVGSAASNRLEHVRAQLFPKRSPSIHFEVLWENLLLRKLFPFANLERFSASLAH